MAAGPRDTSTKVSLVHGEDPAIKAWLGIFRVFQKMQREMDHVLDAAGISAAQFDVLANLGMSEGITQRELAERLLVTKGNVCGLLDRMEAAGLVERRTDAKDRRANRIHLTRVGRGALRRAFPPHLVLVQRCMGSLSVAEMKTLTGLLSRLEAGDCFE